MDLQKLVLFYFLPRLKRIQSQRHVLCISDGNRLYPSYICLDCDRPKVFLFGHNFNFDFAIKRECCIGTFSFEVRCDFYIVMYRVEIFGETVVGISTAICWLRVLQREVGSGGQAERQAQHSGQKHRALPLIRNAKWLSIVVLLCISKPITKK
ncbi:unnamed protein product [Chrysodeixis includens]|uniref:Uncharacterized protein n=1 Tax=Chrysodeixis includens TaxID=689277 RepID=A0A9N8KTB6_CHRIL|nr:unnamed protein product [Chrysodeixis includens]